MAETLHYLLHHALTNIERCRKQAERTQPPRIAAHLDAVIAHMQAVVEDLDDPPKRVILEDRAAAPPV